jgi:ATP-dependent DNA helicase RecG
VNLERLLELIAAGESDRLEFKKTTGQMTDAAKTLCGMLNATGGRVVFGISPDGQARGQTVTTETREKLEVVLRRIEPSIRPEIEVVPLVADLSLICISVNGGGGPYVYDGRAYFRDGPTTSQMPQERYQRLLLERRHAMDRWETRVHESLTLDRLDTEELTRTIDEAVRRGRLDDPGTRLPLDLLRGLGMLDDAGQIRQAAAILFGKTELFVAHFPQACVRLARFKGTDRTEFLDNRQYQGNIFALLKLSQQFLREHLPIAGRVEPDLFERYDDPLYPPEALREALANAFCHRDYADAGGAVSVAIYDNRLEITSTGQLPFGLLPADLTKEHQSRPWNPLIASVLYKRGLIEQWGRGTLKMIELVKRARKQRVAFDCRAGETIVTFEPDAYKPPLRISRDLSENQRLILAALEELGPAPLKSIERYEPLRLGRRSIQENLNALRSLGLVSLTGHGRGAKWRLGER